MAAPATRERSLRILVVDDNDVICDLLCECLETVGHTVSQATDGMQALELFKGGVFDLVLTDHAMPGMSGLQLAAAIKGGTPGIPIILLSGFGSEMQDQSPPEGIDLVLAKPIGVEDLRRAIYEVGTRATVGQDVAPHDQNSKAVA